MRSVSFGTVNATRGLPNPPASSGAPRLWLVVLVVVAVAWVSSGRGCATVVPPPQPPAGPNLVEAFRANDNRREAVQHARTFAAICGSVADYLEYDGAREQPLIKTGVHVDELRRALRQTRTRGWSFLAKYPDLGKALEDHLTQQLGSSGGPIDKAQRDKWVAAMRQVQACAAYAADRG
jgi:hypothetical protein